MLLNKIKIGFRAIVRISNWWDYFLDYLNLRNGEIEFQIKETRLIIRAKSNDKHILTEVLLDDRYLPKELSLPDSPVIIDLGAHIGIFTLFALEKFENPQIYSVEPMPNNFKILCSQLKMNRAKRVVPLNLALSDKDGEEVIFSGKNFSRSSIVRREGEIYSKVKTRTLKSFLEESGITRCDLLKIDIEGGEYPVILSTPLDTFSKIERIFMETHEIEGKDVGEIVSFLENAGYSLKRDVSKNMIYAWRRNSKK